MIFIKYIVRLKQKKISSFFINLFSFLFKGEKPDESKEQLINRLYKQHSTAFYLKMALAIQLKVIYSTDVRLAWSTIASKVYAFQRSIDQEQIFLKNIDLKAIHLSKNMDFQSSITMSSKLAFELVKLTQTQLCS